MRLYVVRHGQTDLNAAHRLQGRKGLPLNAEGLAQASSLKEQLKGVHFDYAFSSPQERAVQTVCIASGFMPKDVVLDERLQPCDMGDADNLVIDDSMHFEFGLLPDRRFFKGVEDPQAFEKRIFEFVDELIDKHGSEPCNVILGGHKCTTGCIDCAVNGFPPDNDFFARSVKNGQYRLYEIGTK